MASFVVTRPSRTVCLFLVSHFLCFLTFFDLSYLKPPLLEHIFSSSADKSAGSHLGVALLPNKIFKNTLGFCNFWNKMVLPPRRRASHVHQTLARIANPSSLAAMRPQNGAPALAPCIPGTRNTSPHRKSVLLDCHWPAWCLS